MSIDYNRIRDIIQIERAKLLSLNDIDAVLEMLRAGETEARNLELQIGGLKDQIETHSKRLNEISTELTVAQKQADADKIQLREDVARVSAEVMAERTKLDKQMKDAHAKHGKLMGQYEAEITQKADEVSKLEKSIAEAEAKISQYKADFAKLMGGK